MQDVTEFSLVIYLRWIKYVLVLVVKCWDL